MGYAPLAAAPALGWAAFRMTVRGALTLDLGVGRRVRPLGPLTVVVDAPRQTVFDVVAAPYLGRTPRAMAEKLDVIERGTDMVLAVHRTPAGSMTAVTVETVRFEPPERVHFRLVRGPVPHVVEQFALTERPDGGTDLVYTGELGTDLWALGGLWGDVVARRWEAAVQQSFDSVRTEAERRARSRAR
jgi:hypothetical protein